MSISIHNACMLSTVQPRSILGQIPCMVEFQDAFYYARPTCQRPVGLTKSNLANWEEWLLLFSIRFPNPSHRWQSTEQKSGNEPICQVERQISVRPIKVDFLQKLRPWIFLSTGPNRNGPFYLIWVPTKISGSCATCTMESIPSKSIKENFVTFSPLHLFLIKV